MSDDLSEKREAEEGYRVSSGKAVRLAEWQFRREDREFAVLVNRLRYRNWQRKVYAENGARAEKLRERNRRWAHAHRNEMLRGARERRRRAYRANPQVLRCEACGVEWCRAPWTRGLAAHRRFCSSTCYQRAKKGHIPQSVGWGVAGRVRELAAAGPLTVQQAIEATGASRDTVLHALTRLTKQGVLERVGRGTYRKVGATRATPSHPTTPATPT